MDRPPLKRLLRVLSFLAAIPLAIMGMGGPTGAAAALKATINYFLAETPYEAAAWLTEKGLLPLRSIFILLAIGLVLWAVWPRKSSAPSTASTPSPGVAQTSSHEEAARARLEIWLGPTSTLSPENRLNEAYAEFHRLADQADRGDDEASRLAILIAPWVREAARYFYASSAPYHRIERVILNRLGRFQTSPAVRRHTPPDDPNEIDRGLWDFHFKPSSANAIKALSFLPSGQIGEGRNFNESTWTLTGTTLQILRADGSLQNEFIYVDQGRYFGCVNEPTAQGLINQAIRRH